MSLQSNLIEGGQTVGMAIRAIIVCTVLCVCALPHPVAAQTEQNGGAIAAGDAAIDDRAIALRIKEIFNELDGLEGVTVVVRSGVVTLRGIVGEAQLSDRAQGLASRVDGVVAVINEIEEETSVSERLVPVYERLENRTIQFSTTCHWPWSRCFAGWLSVPSAW